MAERLLEGEQASELAGVQTVDAAAIKSAAAYHFLEDSIAMNQLLCDSRTENG